MHGAALGPTPGDEAGQPGPAQAEQHLQADQDHQRPADRAAQPRDGDEGGQDGHEQEHTEGTLLQILQDLPQFHVLGWVTEGEHRQQGPDALVAVLRRCSAGAGVRR
ncbi:hypothetical protein D3C73_1396100 [compost metagenome]